MSEIAQEESQRIAKAVEDFRTSNPGFIFCKPHLDAIGAELERLNSIEMAAGRDFNITKETLEAAFSNLVTSGKIEVAALPQRKTEESVTGNYVPFLSDVEEYNPHSAVQAQKDTAYWTAKRKAAEDADLASRRKAAEEIFGRGSKPKQEEEVPRIPDSVSECDEAERARIFLRFPAESIRNFLQRERAKAGR